METKRYFKVDFEDGNFEIVLASNSTIAYCHFVDENGNDDIQDVIEIDKNDSYTYGTELIVLE